jgi:hypothetical protein
MIARDENALICDFAETYHIYDYRSMPPRQAAILAVGLSPDSRIKREFSGMKYPIDTILLAHIADTLRILVWFQTKDGHNGTNRPESIYEKMMEEKHDEYVAFSSIEDYEAARARIIGT